MMNQDMSKILINSPVSFLIGIGKSTSSYRVSYAPVIKFILHTWQAGRNIPETFSIGQLCEELTQILIKTSKRLHLMTATITFHILAKLMKR